MRETVARIIEDLNQAINKDNHKIQIHIEKLDDIEEVSFYLDDEEDAVGVIVVTSPED